MPSSVRKRSVNIAGHKTSVSPEEEFWSALKEIAVSRNVALFELVASIEKDRDRDRSNFSSTLRLFVLAYYRKETS